MKNWKKVEVEIIHLCFYLQKQNTPSISRATFVVQFCAKPRK